MSLFLCRGFMKLPATLMIATFSHLVTAQSIHDLFGTETFHRAYFAPKTRDVTFEGFQELKWEAKARTALPWLNLDRPTPAQIARLSTFDSAGPQFRSVDFRAPLDPAVGRAAYLLIHATGITAIRPAQLRGSVNFDFDERMTVVQRKVFFGVVVAEPARPVTTAAFTIVGTPADIREVRVGARFERKNPSSPAVYGFNNGDRTVTWTASSTEQLTVKSAVSFRVAGQHLLLVKWNNDLCGSSYTLFSVDNTLKPIAGNNYECDP